MLIFDGCMALMQYKTGRGEGWELYEVHDCDVMLCVIWGLLSFRLCWGRGKIYRTTFEE